MGELIRLNEHRRRKSIVARVGRRLQAHEVKRGSNARLDFGSPIGDPRWLVGGQSATATNGNHPDQTA